MNINEQEKAINFMYKHDISCDVNSRMLNLMSEVGKLSNLVIKNTEYGKENFKGNSEIDDQLGEIYLVLLELASEVGVDLNDAIKRTIEKNDIKLCDKEKIRETVEKSEKNKSKEIKETKKKGLFSKFEK